MKETLRPIVQLADEIDKQLQVVEREKAKLQELVQRFNEIVG